jgi:predicted transposase
MKLNRTARFKINIEGSILLPSLKAYTKAFNFASASGYKNNIFNKRELQKICYRDCRDKFDLPAQLAISAIFKAAEAIKSIKKNKYAKCPQSKLSSIRLDDRSYSVFKDNTVSILTLEKKKEI